MAVLSTVNWGGVLWLRVHGVIGGLRKGLPVMYLPFRGLAFRASPFKGLPYLYLPF